MQRAGTPLSSTEGRICRPAQSTSPASGKGQGELLTRMLGSLSECLARAMASSVTLVSPLAWISRTAIWGQGQVTPRGGTAQARWWGRASWERPWGYYLQCTHPEGENVHSGAIGNLCKQGDRVRAGGADAGRMRGAGRRRVLLDSPPYSGGKKCRFRGSSRSARMGLRRSSGSATGSAGDERTGRLHGPPSPRVPTHHWRRCGATLRRPDGRKSGRHRGGALGILCPRFPKVPSPALLPCPALPAPPRPHQSRS